jgi:small subunit ribosomal protein S1
MTLSSKTVLTGLGTEVTWEDQDTAFEHELTGTSEFASLFEQTQGDGENIKEGSIVKGKVVNVSDDYVLVDIGHKTDGEIPIYEFKDAEGTVTVSVGDEVEVYLDCFEDNYGDMILSRERAEMLRAWDRISEAYENSQIIEGSIISRVKGGLSVDIGVKAFLPGSQVDLRPVRNLDKLIGQKFEFKIIKFNKKRGNIVLSRRVLLEQDREKMRGETLENLAEGSVVKGIIKNITDYGAFVDLGGIDGLLHITDMSWGRINHPTQLFDVGQEVEVKVLSYDDQRHRVSLGYKQLQSDPWGEATAKYEVGTKTHGVVVSLTDYGAFVELEDGVEGLIHISEMSWSKRVRHPSKVVSIGDEVNVVVLAIDPEARRISLGMKQMEPNPWEVIKEKYHEGDVISGKIRNITDFGIFVGVEEGIDGLIHISDISWTDRIKHPGDKFKKGDEVQAKVLQIDVEGEKFSLGIKQLTEDPWDQVTAKYTPGSKHNGEVTKVTDFGAFVKIPEGFEGLIHVSELSKDGVEKASDAVKEGDSIEFVVLSNDSEERKLSLSRKAVEAGLDGDALNEYVGKNAKAASSALAEAFAKAEEEKGE